MAFTRYTPVKIDYENWCADNGYVPLGIGNLKKAMAACGFERTTQRSSGGKAQNMYKLVTVGNVPLTPLNMQRPELFTTNGFEPTKVPEFDSVFEKPEDKPVEEVQPKKTILKGEW